MPRGGPRTGPTVGGKRAGAGRPRTRLTLSKAAALTLHLLTKIQRQIAPATTPEMVLEHLIDEAWQESDADFEHRAAAAATHGEQS